MNTGLGDVTMSDIQDYIKTIQTKRNKLLLYSTPAIT